MQNIFIELLPPWIETGLQPAFYDKESGTVLQQVSRMWAKMIELGQAFNTFSEDTADTVNDYIERFTTLYNYVHDYFDNLDVQEEINNKLDDMVEQGTLQEIITTYIQANVAWTFDTVADMKSATNLVAGSYAQTLGFHSLNDGGGAIYKITDSGTADECTVIAVGDLYANLIAENVMNTKQFGVIADGTEDDTTLLQKTLDFCKGKVNTLNLIGTEFYTTLPLDFTQFKNTTFNFCANLHRKSSATTSFGLRITQCENCNFNDFSLSTSRDQTEQAPAGHTRVSSLGSNIIGVIIYASSNLKFTNCEFSNTASDFFNQIYNGGNLESNNIIIDGWYSRNSSGSLFVQRINNLYINNADILPAVNMGDGDHHIYCSQYVNGVYVTNSKFTSPDTNFGVSIAFNATGDGASDANCPKNLVVENCTYNITDRVIYQERLSNSKFINCTIDCDGGKTVFTANGSSSVEFDNCKISGKYNGLTSSYNGSLTVILRNCDITNSNPSLSTQLLVYAYSATPYTPTLIVEGCTIDYARTIYYSGGNVKPTILFKNNKVKMNIQNYAFSIREEDCRVDINNNIIINSDSYAYFCYNSLASNTHMNIYYNVISGFTNLGASAEVATMNANYNTIS